MGFLERAKPPIRAIGVCAAVSVPCCFFTGTEVAERRRLAFICWSLAAFEDSMVAVILYWYWYWRLIGGGLVVARAVGRVRFGRFAAWFKVRPRVGLVTEG